jgi:hypothetical protein
VFVYSPDTDPAANVVSAIQEEVELSNMNGSVVVMDTVTRTICGQTKQAVARVADAVLITYAVVMVAVLAAGARYLL